MKRSISVLLFFLFFSGCQKLGERLGEDLIIKAMTEGQWRVSRFLRNNDDVTSGFSPYAFQFKKDNTVDAINNTAVEKTGTWEADPTTRTITAQFDGSGPVLMLLNGSWHITDNSWTFVEATQSVNGEVRTLRLNK